MIAVPDFKVEVEVKIVRDSAGRLRDLGGRLTKLGTTVESVYKFKSREFLDRAAAELYNIPSAERYEAWHTGNLSQRPRRKGIKKGLAAAITDYNSNTKVTQTPEVIRYRVFSTSYMDSVAKHWASVEYGGAHNIAAAAQRRISFRDPGSGKLQSARTSPPFTGVGVIQGRKIPKSSLRSKKSQRGLVKRPIRRGAYLERAYAATIRQQLENELRRRVISDLSRG